MVKAIPFMVEGWHAPAGRPTCEPRPLVQVGQIRPATQVVPGRLLGPGRQIVSQDNPSGVSRFGGQAGTQASDLTPAPGQNHGSRAGSTTHSLPAESGSRRLVAGMRPASAQIAMLCAGAVAPVVVLWAAAPEPRSPPPLRRGAATGISAATGVGRGGSPDGLKKASRKTPERGARIDAGPWHCPSCARNVLTGSSSTPGTIAAARSVTGCRLPLRATACRPGDVR